jgi:hypothetical protein
VPTFSQLVLNQYFLAWVEAVRGGKAIEVGGDESGQEEGKPDGRSSAVF